MMKGPRAMGNRFDTRCSRGCAYIATMPTGAVHS